MQIPTNITADMLNRTAVNMVKYLDIQFLEVAPTHITASMPVDHRTQQPMGLLHGGASVVLAETLGSVGANLCVQENGQYCVGLEINANHIKSARSGRVIGTAKPMHIGKRTQVWEISIVDETDALVCISRITMAVIDKK
jgi:1,4-dihydroxy-2-naphthoyl-CoA hydrolase